MEGSGGVTFVSSINSKPSFFLTEHLHWPCSSFASHQSPHSQLLKPSSASDGIRKFRSLKTNYAMDEEERRIPRGSSSSTRWSNQKRLLSLFKNIETSISQEKARTANSSKDDIDSSNSVLEALQQSGQMLKKASETKKEAGLLDVQPSALKVTQRPPSNFVRKSPIPSPSTPRISSIEQNVVVESSDGVVEDEEPLALQKMKLTQLREVAKGRGIKGYSKLKKSELLDFLSSGSE